MNADQAMELIESVFTFDYIGDSMMAVRANLEEDELQKEMVKELVKAALENASDNSPETIDAITKAAEARVQQYVTSSKKSKGTGCG